MEQKGILIVVSGFSGAGKGTLMKGLLEKYDNYALSISATTRKPREGEEEGKAYFFKETEEFEKMIAQDELIEYARYVNNYYGTPRAYVEEQLSKGKAVIVRDSAECCCIKRAAGRARNGDNGSDRIPHAESRRRS